MKTGDNREFIYLPILPADFDVETKRMTPQERTALEKRLQANFVKMKAQLQTWIRQDRDSRMNPTAKLIAAHMLERVNFKTGRCYPSNQSVADDLGKSVRTVERTIPLIVDAGWMSRTRIRRNMPYVYQFHAPEWKVKLIDEEVIARREHRSAARADRYRSFQEGEANRRRQRARDPTEMAGQPQFDPTIMAAPDPTVVAGKHEERTPERKLGSEQGDNSTGRDSTSEPNAYERKSRGS